MSRAIVSLLTLSFLVFTISCAKSESSDIPTTAQATRKTPPSRSAAQRNADGGASISVGLAGGEVAQVPEKESDAESGESAPKSNDDGKTEESQDSGTGEADPSTTAEGNTEASGTTESSGTKVMIADGGIQLIVPEGWKEATPASNMIEVEFSVPGEDEQAAGRVTGMMAGGSVEANIDRWYGQFVQPDGSPTKDHAKLEELEVGKLKIHAVDIPGTFLEGMGPIAPKTERENYRMLAAIIEMEGDFNYFLKFSGPAELVEKHAEGFFEMLKGMKSAD